MKKNEIKNEQLPEGPDRKNRGNTPNRKPKFDEDKPVTEPDTEQPTVPNKQPLSDPNPGRDTLHVPSTE